MDIAFKIQKETWPDDPDYEDLYDKAINKEDNNCFFLVYDKNVLVGITGVDVYDNILIQYGWIGLPFCLSIEEKDMGKKYY